MWDGHWLIFLFSCSSITDEMRPPENQTFFHLECDPNYSGVVPKLLNEKFCERRKFQHTVRGTRREGEEKCGTIGEHCVQFLPDRCVVVVP